MDTKAGNGRLTRALIDIKGLGIVADMHNRKEVQLMLYKRGENDLAMLVDELSDIKYDELIDSLDSRARLIKGKDIHKHIETMAKEMDATIDGTMSIKEVLTILDTVPEILITMDILLKNRAKDKYAPVFYDHIQKERDTMEAGVLMMRDALKQAPKLTGITNGQQVEKNIHEIWADYKEQLSVKKFIEDNKDNADELAKIRLTSQLQFINASLNAIDDFLSHSMIVMATKN